MSDTLLTTTPSKVSAESDDKAVSVKPEPEARSPPDQLDPLNVILLLDVTGSMSAEIEACKRMCSTFARSYAEQPDDGIILHIITYTEENEGCYLEHISGTSAELAVKASKIKLSQCHGPHGGSGSGGDGDENVIAALTYATTQIDGDRLVFIVTDAPPHVTSHSTTMDAEARWMVESGLDVPTKHDAYAYGREIIEFATANAAHGLICVPVLTQPSAAVHWYHQMAKETQGLVLLMADRNSDMMATALRGLVESLQVGRAGGDDFEVPDLMNLKVAKMPSLETFATVEEAAKSGACGAPERGRVAWGARARVAKRGRRCASFAGSDDDAASFAASFSSDCSDDEDEEIRGDIGGALLSDDIAPRSKLSSPAAKMEWTDGADMRDAWKAVVATSSCAPAVRKAKKMVA